MATKAKAAKNTLVQLGDGGGPEVFTTIAEVLSFTGPSEEAAEINVTSQDSTAQEYISSGLPDSPDMNLEVNFVGSSAQQQALAAAVSAGTTHNFKYILNDHATTKTTYTFAAIVKAFQGPSFSTGEAYKATIVLRRTGAVTKSYAPA